MLHTKHPFLIHTNLCLSGQVTGCLQCGLEVEKFVPVEGVSEGKKKEKEQGKGKRARNNDKE